MAEKDLNEKLKKERMAAEAAVKRMAEGSREVDPDTLPLPLSKVKGTPHEEIVRIHARQAQQGLIQICDVKGCYYPLQPVRDPANNNDPKIATERDEESGEDVKIGVVGLCSWAGKEHGEQVIRPPIKPEDI